MRDVEEVPLVAVFSFSGAEVVQVVTAYLEGCGGGASCGHVQLQWCWWPLTLRDVEEVPLVAVFSFSGAEVVLVVTAYLEGCGVGASCGRVQLLWL